MKKRILFITSILTALLIALSLCACSNDDDSTAETPIFPEISIATAYNQATELGFTGSLDDFIELISGKDGKDGINGTNGKDGKDGVNGINGINGKDGRGISSVAVNATGELVVTFTDGNSVNAGSVVIQCVHSYGAWQTEVAATCTSIGYDVRVCDKCGDMDYRFTEQLGHDYDNAATVIKKHCTEYGLQVLTCTRCGDTKSEPIEPQGHGLSYPSYTCVYCGKSSHDIYLEENFDFYLLADGTAYEISGRKRDTEGELVIPSEYKGLPVTKIRRGGFGTYRKITKVIIPESVTEIDLGAFVNCTSLKTIIIPKTVTAIESRAFMHVDPDDIQIDPENPIYFGDGSYIADSTTKTFVYGNSTINIPDDGSVEHIGIYAFAYHKDVGDIVIPEGIKTIGTYAFNSCSGVTSLTLPSTVTDIANNAFGLFAISESITVSSLNTVYKSQGNCLIDIANKTLVKGCNSSVIPSDGSVETIGAEAFRYCKGISEITIPQGVISIMRYAFRNTDVSNISLPDTLQYIGDDAFDMTPYYSNKDNWVDGALYIGKFLIATDSSLPEEYTVRDGTLTIACYAFQYRKLKKLTICDSVKYIGSHAFEYCNELTDIKIGAGVEIIGAFAFYACNSLTNAELVNHAWERYTQVTEPESFDMSNPAEAAELLRNTTLRIDNYGYGYVWYKSDTNSD